MTGFPTLTFSTCRNLPAVNHIVMHKNHLKTYSRKYSYKVSSLHRTLSTERVVPKLLALRAATLIG